MSEQTASPNRRRRLFRAVALSGLALLGGCGLFESDPEPADVNVSPRTVTFDAVGDTAQLSASVFDAEGVEIEGAAITWSSSDPGVVRVNDSGLVTSTGQGSGTVLAEAGTVAGSVSAVVAITIAEIEAVSPTQFIGTAGQPVEELQVEVQDRLGSPIPGAVLRAQIISGEGQLSDSVMTSDASGVARTTWTLGTVAGSPQQVRVRPNSGSSVSVFFSAEAQAGPPEVLTLDTGADQFGLIGSTLPVPLTLSLTDAVGNPITTVPLELSVTAGNGTLSETQVTPDSAGRAEITWTLGPDVGVQTVDVSAADLTLQVSATALSDPAALAVVSGASASGVVGQPLGEQVQVRLEDTGGTGIPGVPIRFAVAAGNGSLANAPGGDPSDEIVVETDVTGVATVPEWVMGTSSGTQSLEVSFPGLTPVVVSATAGPGAPAALSVSSGDFQTAELSAALVDPVLFTVQDVFGNAVPGVEVQFVTGGGSGDVASASATTDEDGLVSAAWTLGSTVGLQTLTASTGAGSVEAYAAGLLPVASDFQVETRFLVDDVPPSVWAAFKLAENRWAQIILDDVPDQNANIASGQCGPSAPEVQELVDDVIIFASVEEIDGPGSILGSAGPCWLRSGSSLPFVGRMRFDVEDLERIEQQGTLIDLILHEMGHVLGIGTLWDNLGLLVNPSPSGTIRDTHFIGSATIDAFNAIGGQDYSGEKVPVENTGGDGTRNGHWRESVFDTELMTGFLDGGFNPLSIVTQASLEDLGYGTTDLDADDFVLPAPRASSGRVVEGLELIGDIWELPIYIAPEWW